METTLSAFHRAEVNTSSIMIQTDNFKKVEVTSSQQLREWLTQHHQQKESVWLVTYKKTVADKYLSTSEVLDELLCFGWIDGIRRKLDEDRTMQLISPRRVEHWAKSYKERAAKLIEEGKMAEPGYQSIELSKQAGLWDFMDDVDKLIVPEDLLKALAAYEGASEFFHAINDSSKRFVLRWIKLAKTEKTRAARILQIAELSAKGEKLKGS
jgi:uncharacterized protein YdeI (YjbR/CyaY-like superfamily)